ncbi:MAG: flagellar hook protein FlgE [Bacillota bacterium]
MMRSMYSGVSGLRAHQMKMDIIGNNIANVNTIGYKGQRVSFQEVYSQTVKGAGSPQAGKGGTNPHQVGLGISLSSIDTYHIRGAVQRTDNNTDLAVNGDGFFILSDSSDYLNRTYTRAGNFSLDEAGNLVASNGYKVLGYMYDDNGNPGSALEGIVISKSEAVAATASTKGFLEGNLDSGLKRITVNPTWQAYVAGPSEVREKVVYSADTETKEMTTSFYDSLGNKHNVKFTFVRGLSPDGTTTGSTDSTWGVTVQYLDNTSPTNNAVNQQYFRFTTDTPTSGVLAGGYGSVANINEAFFGISFDTNGKYNSAIKTLRLTLPAKNGSGTTPVDINLEQITQFANESNVAAQGIDGYPQGYLDTFTIGPTGEINGVFTNGQNKVIGRMAMAVFKNPAGLEKTAENMYAPTPNSGEPVVGLPGTGGMGTLNPGTLEMSNVDISREFTEMISTQRGFQANSRIITASDEMLQELVNLKR